MSKQTETASKVMAVISRRSISQEDIIKEIQEKNNLSNNEIIYAISMMEKKGDIKKSQRCGITLYELSAKEFGRGSVVEFDEMIKIAREMNNGN